MYLYFMNHNYYNHNCMILSSVSVEGWKVKTSLDWLSPEDGVSSEEREGEAGLRLLEAGGEVAHIGVQQPDRAQQATSSEMFEDGVAGLVL